MEMQPVKLSKQIWFYMKMEQAKLLIFTVTICNILVYILPVSISMTYHSNTVKNSLSNEHPVLNKAPKYKRSIWDLYNHVLYCAVKY